METKQWFPSIDTPLPAISENKTFYKILESTLEVCLLIGQAVHTVEKGTIMYTHADIEAQ